MCLCCRRSVVVCSVIVARPVRVRFAVAASVCVWVNVASAELTLLLFDSVIWPTL